MQNSCNSCNGKHSCSFSGMPDDSVGMDAHLTKSAQKRAKVMNEFKNGKLKSSSGETVTNPKQAVAIGYSEASRQSHKDLIPSRDMSRSIEKFNEGKLLNSNRQVVNSRNGAREQGSVRTGQAYSDQIKKFKNADRYGIRKGK